MLRPGEPLVAVTDLCHRFGQKDVLAGVSFEVRAGTTVALLGRNGAGKTTLLRLLAGWLRPRPGRARVLGLDPAKDGPAIRLHTGFTSDHLELARGFRVRQHLAFLRCFYPSWRRAEEARLTAAFGLDPEARVAELSKGQRAQLALIGALAHRPRLLLLDEPFAGLDPEVRRSVIAALVEHMADASRATLLVTHSTSDVERLADRVLFLDRGRIAAEGDAESVRRDLDAAFHAVVAQGSEDGA